MGERVWPVLLASAVSVALLLLMARDDDGSGDTDGDPVAAFLAAYERSRTATFVVEQRFTRTTPDGGELVREQRLVQRPPDDRMLIGGGNAEGRLGGRVVRCSTAPDGTSACIEGPPARPYDEEVAAEVAALRQLVDGDRPVYEVVAGAPGCWSLHLRLAVLSPPYGETAGFCFDPETGAPSRLEIRKEEAIDVIDAIRIKAEVTAADLRPEDLGELPGS